jgi:hypothetical protein
MIEAERIGEIQYLPVRVVKSTGERIEGFSVANILNCVAALDLQVSSFSVYPEDYLIASRRGSIRSLNAPVLRAAAVAAFDIIRLREYYTPIYVSGRFVRLFHEGQFTGCSFREVPTSE